MHNAQSNVNAPTHLVHLRAQFHEHGLRIIPHHSEPALQSEEDAIDLKNISREVSQEKFLCILSTLGFVCLESVWHQQSRLRLSLCSTTFTHACAQITNARLTLQRIQETVDAAKESLAKFMQEWSGTVPSQDKVRGGALVCCGGIFRECLLK